MANEKDDLLDPAEIEALLSSAAGALASSAGIGGAGAGTPPAAAPAPTAPVANPPPAAPPRREPSGPEALLDQAAANLSAAVAPDLRGPRLSESLAEAHPYEFAPFDSGAEAEAMAKLGTLKDVELDLRIELGRAELLIEDVLKLREGSVVPLDKLAGDPVDILVNGRLIARGEVLVLNDNFCVRVAEILAPTLIED